MAKNSKSLSQKPNKRKKKKKVYVYFLLDESGSMRSRYRETISGFNEFLQQQQQLQKEKNVKIKFSFTTFNGNGVKLRYVEKNVRKIEPLSVHNYKPVATTPLFDAVYNSIRAMDKRKKVLFVVLTDGLENASRQATLPLIRSLIKEKKQQKWEFLFLGVDLTDTSDARRMQINDIITTDNMFLAYQTVYNKLDKMVDKSLFDEAGRTDQYTARQND